uniref:Uncharacterized protein n=1 Tax=Anguilla anguilla TaxID=7936 RepID=A0A0E9PG28_ANGAN
MDRSVACEGVQTVLSAPACRLEQQPGKLSQVF